MSLLAKMEAAAKGSSGGFYWKTMTVLSIFLIAIVVNKDVSKHGSFSASRTGVFLQDINLFSPSVSAYDKSMYMFHSAKNWVDIHGPVYLESGQRFASHCNGEAARLAGDAWETVETTFPLVSDKVNEYLPIVKDKFIVLWAEASEVAQRSGIWLAENGRRALAVAADNSRAIFTASSKYINGIMDGKIELKDVFASVKDASLTTYDFLSYQALAVMDTLQAAINRK